VLDILVPEVVLQSARIVAIVGELEAAGVAQHVRMDGKRHLNGLAEPCHEVMEADGRHRSASLGNKHMSFCGVLSPQSP
jgi:hypothetical protein